MKVYNNRDYKELAKAVKAGFPEEEAQKIIEQQREVGGKGEEKYWLEISQEKPAYTTIQIHQETKEELKEIQFPGETYEDTILRLIDISREEK